MRRRRISALGNGGMPRNTVIMSEQGMGMVEILVLGSIVLALSLPVIRTVLTYQNANERVVEAAFSAAQAAGRTGDDRMAEDLARSIVCGDTPCNATAEVNIGTSRVSAYVERTIDLPLVGPVTIISTSQAELSQFRSGHRGSA
ncbi:MAG: hypothetical protein KJO36_05695 [Acidimicrobiia bacterium]|nr:hypothetical protein [Acidimicrobiia bacterium]NNL47433.1 hypothetical protein [Acidimicrobiia bacterium]